MKFRVLIGKHCGAHPRGEKDSFGNVKTVTWTQGSVLEAGMASDGRPLDLCAKFNCPGMQPKFERVPDDTPVTPIDAAPAPLPGPMAGYGAAALQGDMDPQFARNAAPPAALTGSTPAAPPAPGDAVFQGNTIDHMTLEELKKHASEEQIPLGKAKTKDEVLAAIKAAYGVAR